jgi:hypothetical protein
VAASVLIAALAALSAALIRLPDSSAPSGQTSLLASLTSALRPEVITVPSGTRLHIRLEEGISTRRNSSGDRFTASLDGPITVDGRTVAPSHSKVVGQLTQVKQSGRIKGRAAMTMVLRKLVVDGKEYDLKTAPVTLVAPRTWKRDAFMIAGPAVLGTLIGALAGGGKGAAIGAGAGGGAGTGWVLGTRGKPVAYGPEARFGFTLAAPLELPASRGKQARA